MELVPARTRPVVVVGALLALAYAGLTLWRRAHAGDLPSRPAAFASVMPLRVLWAWEVPEDLHTLSTAVGVAYLAETILLGDGLSVVPRRQPLTPAPGAPVMAVVRVETRAGFADSSEMRTALVTRLAEIARSRPMSALQIDFDATLSQRAFYAAVLRGLRPQVPPSLPLSITALVSWCGSPSWIHGLPIDEAVPMFFRMGGPRSLPAQLRPQPLREPLCRTSLGLSTDEAWPPQADRLHPAARVYLFSPGPWRPEQLQAVATTSLPRLHQELAP